MEGAETPRQRLARLMDERRSDLDLTWNEVAERAGITREGLRRTRVGTGRIRSLTKRGIERALQWAAGSVDAILRGDGPLPAVEPPADPMGAAEETLDDMERRVADMKQLSRRDLAAIDALIEALKSPDRNGEPTDNRHR